MQRTSIELRPLAILAGLVSSGLAIYSLLYGAEKIELTHVLTVGAVVLAIVFGHLAKTTWSRSKSGAVAAAMVFIVATLVTALNSAGRQAETADTKVMAIQAGNNRIERLESDYQAAERSRLQIAGWKRAECKGAPNPLPVKGWPLCRKFTGQLEAMEALLMRLDRDINNAPAPRPVNSKSERFAELAALLGFEKAKVQKMVRLFEPFLLALLFEVGAIVGFGIGFGHRKAETSGAAAEKKPSGDRPKRKDCPEKRRNFRLITSDTRPDPGQSDKDRVLNRIKSDIANGRTFRSQREMSDAYGIARSTFSDWMKEWESDGLISRITDGRTKHVA